MTDTTEPSVPKQGDKVRIVFTTGAQKDREAVFRFLAINTHPHTETLDEFVFDARPLAGTQVVYRRDIRQLFLCHPSETCFLPRIYRGETRLL